MLTCAGCARCDCSCHSCWCTWCNCTGQRRREPLGVDELAGDRVVGLITCEREGDVVAVVAPLGGVAQVIFHGVQVVEVGVEVGVHEEGEKEKDGEAQEEVKGDVEHNRTCTCA